MKKNYQKILGFLFFFSIFFSFVGPVMADTVSCNKDEDCNSPLLYCKPSPPLVTGVCAVKSSGEVVSSIPTNQTPTTNNGDCSWEFVYNNECPSGTYYAWGKCPTETRPATYLSMYDTRTYYCCCKGATGKTIVKSVDINPLGNLQVKIPGIDKLVEKHPATCSTDSDGKTSCSIPWIAIYIKAIYNYFLYIGGIVAVIALMIGGVIWLVSAGNASRISEAKSWISGSIIGIVILLLSYTLLYQINPELTRLRALNLKNIDPIEGDSDTPSQNSSAGMPFSSSASSEHLTAIGIQCPQGGGSAKISEISKSFAGKVVYRFGSKNGQGSEQKEDKAQETYGLLCPNNDPWREKVVCYDCSGFARQVLWCAGFSKDPGMGTSVMFNPASAEKIESCGSNTINNKELIAGDLIGWHGHVIMYIGEGRIAEVFANRSYSPAKAYKESAFSCDTISTYQKKYGTLYIKRISDYQN